MGKLTLEQQAALADMRAIAVVMIQAVDNIVENGLGKEVDEDKILEKGLDFALAAFGHKSCALFEEGLVDPETVERAILAFERDQDRLLEEAGIRVTTIN